MPGVLKEIRGTEFIISGRLQFDLTQEDNLRSIREKNVRQVYMIFMGETMQTGYSEEKQALERKLAEELGITFIPLEKRPNNIRPFEIFSRNIGKLKRNEKALVLCYHGLHNSAAYMAYHLMKRGMRFDEIYRLLRNYNWSEASIASAREILRGAGIDAYKFSEKMHQARVRRERLAGAETHGAKLEKLREALRQIGAQRPGTTGKKRHGKG